MTFISKQLLHGATLSALTVLSATLSAQSTPFAVAEVFNPAAHGGTAVTDVVVPLAKGRTKVVPGLITDQGRVCQTRAFGAPWPDGTLRYVKVDLPVEIAPFESRQIQLLPHKGPTPPFKVDSGFLMALMASAIRFHANGQALSLKDLRITEDGQLVKVLTAGVRVKNSCLWAKLRIVAPSGQRHCRFYLTWGNSNPRSTALGEYPTGVQLEVRGFKLGLENAKAKVLSRRTTNGGRDHVVLLHHDGRPIADGQAQCFEGTFYLDNPPPRPRAIAHGWATSMAFGPFGEVFPEHKVDNFEFERLLDKGRSDEVMDPWGSPVHGCYPSPSQTGGHPDFGVIVMRPDVTRADPRRLAMIARSIHQEFCRPTHHREWDLSPVTVAKHPNLLLRSGRPYFREGNWVDTLGKPRRHLALHEYARDPLGRRFTGHDDQHYSINYLCAFAMVTGDRIAMVEVEHHVELWLAEYTANTGTINDKVRSARATGRTLMAGCWLWLLTDRSDLRARIADRAKNVAASLKAPRTGEPAKLPGVLQPRFQLPEGHFWAPWEEALAVIGLTAVGHLFSVPEARWSAAVICSNLVAHGVGPTAKGWRVGYFLPFTPDNGYVYSALYDPLFEVARAGGEGLTGWSLPAILIASRHGLDPGIRALAQRMVIDMITVPGFMERVQTLNWLGVVPRK